MESPKISIIGAGNVAWHLAPALAAVAEVRQVVSTREESAGAVARRVNEVYRTAGKKMVCHGIAGVDAVSPDSDFYIIAAKDDAIRSIVENSGDFPGIWAHTSGSVGMEVFVGRRKHYGSFYPLQTFSKAFEVDVSAVPFFIEGSSPEVAAALHSLASDITRRIYPADSERRKALHVAAVFANNFANRMWQEADRLLAPLGLDIACLLPLVETSVRKLDSLTPAEAMTGPARRGDVDVIRRHLEWLPADMREIYRLLSQRILDDTHPGLLIR